MRIEAVLFVADGVVQRRPREWKGALGERLDFSGDPGGFLEDVFEAEQSALEGQSDFTQELSQVLSRWNCCCQLATLALKVALGLCAIVL